MLWLKDIKGFSLDFASELRASVEEESLAPLNVSYRRAERVWWQQVSESGEVRTACVHSGQTRTLFEFWYPGRR